MKKTRRILSLVLSLAISSSCFVTPAFANSDFTEETVDGSAYYQETTDITADDGSSYLTDNIDTYSDVYADAVEAVEENAGFDAALSADADTSVNIDIVTTENSNVSTAADSDAVVTEIIYTENIETNVAEESTPAADTAVSETPEELRQELETVYTRIRLFTPGTETFAIYKLNDSKLTDEQLNGYLNECQADEQTVLESYFFEPYPENNEYNHVELMLKNADNTSELEKVHIYLIDSTGRIIAYVGEIGRSDNNSFEITEDNSGILKKAEFDFAPVTDRNGNICQPAGFVVAKIKEAAAEQPAGHKELITEMNVIVNEEPAEEQTAETSESSEEQSIENEESDAEQTTETSEPVTELNAYAVTKTVLARTIDSSDGRTYKITVEYGGTSGIPADAELKVEELSEEVYAAYLIEAAGVLGADLSEFSYGRLFDISIVKDRVEYQPNDMVTVTVELLDAENVNDIQVVHFGAESEAEQLSASTDGTAVTFETSGFSVFSFLDKITTTLEQITTSILDGQTGTLYENDDIILTGRMPALGIVEAKRVDVSVDGQDALVAYDIKIYAGPLSKALGYTWQPEDSAITVTLKSDALAGYENVSVYHFADGAAEPEKVADADINGNCVEFQAESFSIYALGENHLRTYRFFTYNDNMKYVEYEMYTDAETVTFTQIIKDAAEGLTAPQLPSIPGSDNSTFAGWYEGSGMVRLS